MKYVFLLILLFSFHEEFKIWSARREWEIYFLILIRRYHELPFLVYKMRIKIAFHVRKYIIFSRNHKLRPQPSLRRGVSRHRWIHQNLHKLRRPSVFSVHISLLPVLPVIFSQLLPPLQFLNFQPSRFCFSAVDNIRPAVISPDVNKLMWGLYVQIYCDM